MKISVARRAMNRCCVALLVMPMLGSAPHLLWAQAASGEVTPSVEVPDWALPSSPTHKQIAPPADFHRASRNFGTPIGIFQGQSDIGAALVPATASYDAATKQYTVNSAGYNIWYTRDEFRYLWKKMSGDVSLAADGSFPIAAPPHDRKIVLVIRQDLDDGSKEIMADEHGTGIVRLAERAEKNGLVANMPEPGSAASGVMPQRIGIEKHGAEFTLFISLKGEPMHPAGPPVTLHIDGPFYVGIGFCAHYPATVDTGVISNVLLENVAGKVR
jgi:hypothetical protein